MKLKCEDNLYFPLGTTEFDHLLTRIIEWVHCLHVQRLDDAHQASNSHAAQRAASRQADAACQDRGKQQAEATRQRKLLAVRLKLELKEEPGQAIGVIQHLAMELCSGTDT